MNKLRCIVVDDEPLAIKMLEGFIARTQFLDLQASFNDPVEALSAIKAQQPELVFPHPTVSEILKETAFYSFPS